jgi:hypothetical protein
MVLERLWGEISHLTSNQADSRGLMRECCAFLN